MVPFFFKETYLFFYLVLLWLIFVGSFFQVPGEEGKTTNYFSHQVFLGPRPSHTVTFTISVEPLTGTNVPVVSSAPGNFYVVNVTAPQRNFPLAELTTASKFQDMFVLRASPSYSVDDFKMYVHRQPFSFC